MMEPISFSLHQDIAFLIRSDMAEHQIMQSIMRHVAREFATADLIAANLAGRSVQKSETEVRIGIDPKKSLLDAMERINQLNYPLALKRGLEQFGLRESAPREQFRDQARDQSREHYSAADQNEKTEQTNENQSESQQENTALDSEDIAVFQSVDQLMPMLQDENLCTGVQLGLYRTPSTLNSFWRDNLVVVLLPVGGRLGQRNTVFTYLLRRGFEVRAIQGRVTTQAGNPIQPLPYQELWSSDEPQLVIRSCLGLERVRIIGKSFLIGLINRMPPSLHWLDLDHRDLNP